MIYRSLYQLPETKQCITPDLFTTRCYLDNPRGKTKQPTPIMIIRKSGTGLLRTCKQVNTEATAILYGANTFTFEETMHPVRANSSLSLPEDRKLLSRLLSHGGMNDLLQMKDFFQGIGVANRLKIRHLKIEIDVHSVFLGYVPFPHLYTGYSAIGPSGNLTSGGNLVCEAINMMAGGSLTSFEVSRSCNLMQHSLGFEFTFIDPKRMKSDDHTIQYASYRMFEACGSRGIDSPLGRSIRSLKGVELICRDMGLWDHGKCDKSSCRICMQIKGFKIMQKEMRMGLATVSCFLPLELLD